MKTFKDNEGREWLVEVNVDTVKRVKSLTGVDLLEIVDGDLIESLCSDPVLLCDVVYSVCKPQCETRGLTDEDFGRALGGDSISDATSALLDALVDFFPKRKRQVLQEALAKMRELEIKAIELASQAINSLEFDKKMSEALSGLGNSFGIAGQSSDATLDD